MTDEARPFGAAPVRNRVIGFCGPIGCGKSTAARILMERYGYRRERFADPLKAMLAALGLSPEELDGPAKEAPAALLGGRTPRHAMQTLGTEWGRQLIDPDLWVRAWELRVGGYWRRFHAPVVSDDVRFGNEVAAIRAMGGLVVRIERPAPPPGADAPPSPASGRGEETAAYPLVPPKGSAIGQEAVLRGTGAVAPLPRHESERQPIAADFTIINGGDLDDLAEAVCRLPNRGAA